MSKTALIALVATALMVDGERVVIPAGQPLPPLKDAERDELLASKSARAPVVEPTGAAEAAAPATPAPAPAPKPAARKKS